MSPIIARPHLIGITLGLLALGLMAARPASAQVVGYGTFAGFQAASASLNAPFTFDSYAPIGQVSYGHNATFDGISFTSGGFFGGLTVASPTAGYGDAFGGHSFLKGSAGQPLYMTLAPGTMAFAADWSGLGGPIQVSVNGQAFTFGDGTTFAGFTSADPITNITFTGGGAGPALDGMVYGVALPNGGPAAPVPETSPALSLALLLALGACGLGWAARNRKASA